MNKSKVVASIQVRMGSSRLPGKVMRQIEHRPLLGHLIDRLRLSKNLDDIIVATSVNRENDVIELFCNSEGVECYRGSEEDVLERTLGALTITGAVIGVEVFGDCPIIDPRIIDHAVDYFFDHPEYEFVSNDLKTTYPPGMEVEVFTVNALRDSSQKLRRGHPDREHGTLFIRQNKGIYRIKNISAPTKHNRPDLELEVDTIEDFEVVTKILEHFKAEPSTSLEQIIEFLDANPELASRNSAVVRKWKQYRDH